MPKMFMLFAMRPTTGPSGTQVEKNGRPERTTLELSWQTLVGPRHCRNPSCQIRVRPSWGLFESSVGEAEITARDLG